MHHGGVSLNETPCSLPNVHQLPTAGAEPHQLLDEQTSKVRQQVATSEAMLPNKMFVCCHNLSITAPMPQAALRPSSTAHQVHQGIAKVSMEPGQVVKPTTHKVLQVLGDCRYVNSPLLPQDTFSPLLFHQQNHLLLLLQHQHHPQEHPSALPSSCALLLHTIASSGDYFSYTIHTSYTRQ